MHAINIFAGAVAAAALAFSASAVAQPRQYSFLEIAADMAYGFCPLFLARELPLDAPQLAERGFTKTVQKRVNPRFGELQIVSMKRAEGEISFGGAPGRLCAVVVTGSERGKALAELRKTMSWMGLPFTPVPIQGPKREGITVEAFKAPIDGQFLTVQLTETPDAVIAEMSATNE